MKISRKNFQIAAHKLPSVSIMVVGDIILDKYLHGDVSRISPEAPVPVVHVKSENLKLGGAGNVINNLFALGCKSFVISRCGQDENSEKLKQLLLDIKIPEQNISLIRSKDIPTTIKTRVIAGHQQVCRIDREDVLPLTAAENEITNSKIKTFISAADGLILSDYDKGFFNSGLIENISKIAKDKYIAVDPQVGHFDYYKKVSILTPNHHEAGRYLGRTIYTDAEIETAALDITKKLDCESVMITRGEKGMTLFQKDPQQIFHIPTVAREVFDVTGAGDTVISVFTAFKLAGLSQLEASVVANAAASLVISRIGAATATVEEIENRLQIMGLFA